MPLKFDADELASQRELQVVIVGMNKVPAIAKAQRSIAAIKTQIGTRRGMRMQNNPFAGIKIGRAIIGTNTISDTGKRHTPAMLGEGDIVGIGATEQKTIYAFTKTVEEFEPFRRCLTNTNANSTMYLRICMFFSKIRAKVLLFLHSCKFFLIIRYYAVS